MGTTANSLNKPVQKSLFPQAKRASNRQMLVAGIVGGALLLFPVPQLLSEAGLITIAPGVQSFYNQAFINAAADAGAYVLLALGLNIVVGYAGLLDLGYVAFFAIGTYSYSILASTYNPELLISGVHVPFWLMLFVAAAITALFGVAFGAPTLRLRG